MKILGRIKKSKVLTAVMTAVLIFQSACPAGLAYAAQKSGVSQDFLTLLHILWFFHH